MTYLCIRNSSKVALLLFLLICITRQSTSFTRLNSYRNIVCRHTTTDTIHHSIAVPTAGTSEISTTMSSNKDKDNVATDFSDRFIRAWRSALQGDQSMLKKIVYSKSGNDIKWNNIFFSDTKELFDSYTQFTSFFPEPALTIFSSSSTTTVGVNQLVSIKYQLSFWYPTFWRPRIIIPGTIDIVVSNDYSSIVSIDEKWDVSIFDIVRKQWLPRLWDIWHILQSPVPEYPPIKLLRKIGDVSILELPETIGVEVTWSGSSKYNGPSVLSAAGFTLFGKLKTSRPNRDAIYATLPVEVQSYKYHDDETNEERKQTSWTYHVPTSLQEKVMDKVKSKEIFSLSNEAISTSTSDSEEGEDDFQAEVDFQIGLENMSLIKSVTGGASRGGTAQLDEKSLKDFESKEKITYVYKMIPRRIVASIDIIGDDVTSDKISKALNAIKETVGTKGSNVVSLLNGVNKNELYIRSRDLSNPLDAASPMVGLHHYHCKGCFNPQGEPAMAVYEIQYNNRVTRVFTELITDDLEYASIL